MFLLGMGMLVSVFFSVDRLRSFSYYIDACVKHMLLVYFITSNMATSRRWVRLYILTMIGMLCMLVFVSSVQSYNIYAGRTGGRGSYSDFNFFGLVLATAVPLALWGIRYDPNLRVRLLHLAGLAVILFGIQLSLSRGAMLAVGVAGLVMIATGQLSRKVMIPILIGGLIALPFVGGEMKERFGAVFELLTKPPNELSGNARNVKNRLNYIRAGLPMFLDHPIGGVGFRNFGRMYLIYLPSDATDRAPRAPHNTYLQTFTENGLVGGVPFLIVLYFAFGNAWALHRRTWVTLPSGEPNTQADPFVSSLSIHLMYSLVAFCVAGTFVAALEKDILWILVGLLAALPSLVEDPSRKPPPPMKPRGAHLPLLADPNESAARP
jgi:O-antigen ligase